MDHSILLSKLPYYGIQDQELKWIRSYLDARTQQVLVNGCLSDPGHLTTGVPQGSILGPLFFVIYTNDMPSVVRYCNVNMYADDTEVHYDDKELPNVEKYLQDDICNIGLWMTSNKLKINLKKSAIMLIGSRQRISNKTITITISNTQIEQVTHFKYLGVMIDKYLTWEEHTNYVLRRVRSKLNTLGRLKPLPHKVLALLYQTYILPIIDYCDIVWTPSSAIKEKQLERLHRKATSNFTTLRKRGFSLCNTLADRRTYHMMVAAYKIVHKMAPRLPTSFTTICSGHYTKSW